MKKGVVGDEIPCPPSGRCSGCFAAVEGNLGFPSESIEDAISLNVSTVLAIHLIYLNEVIHMFRKLSLFLCSLILVLTIFSLNTFYHDQAAVRTFRNHAARNRKLTNKTIQQYLNGSENERENARNLLIHTTLKNMNYEKWLDYQEYIDLLLYTADIMPGSGEELIIVLNLSKDLAVAAVYRSLNQEYVFIHSLENLLPVEKIEFFLIPDLGYQTLNIYQILDERLGAYILEKFVESYGWISGRWQSLWKKTVYMEEIYNQQWINPQSSRDQWIKIVEDNEIRFLQQPNPQIHVTIKRSKLTAVKKQLPMPEDFRLQERIQAHEFYHWSTRFQRYILKEGTLEECTTPVAIIQDLETSVESYLGFISKAYKVTYLNGKTGYIHKDRLSIK